MGLRTLTEPDEMNEVICTVKLLPPVAAPVSVRKLPTDAEVMPLKPMRVRSSKVLAVMDAPDPLLPVAPPAPQ